MKKRGNPNKPKHPHRNAKKQAKRWGKSTPFVGVSALPYKDDEDSRESAG